MNVRQTLRRLALAALAVLVAAAIVRPQLSTALTLRGDEWTARGDLTNAGRFYRRALAVDSANGIAVDRLVFGAVLTHDSTRLHDAVTLATTYLERHSDDATITLDRALVLQVLHDYRGAERDFARTGKRSHDARALTFAGLDALRAGERLQGRALLREAVQADPSFLPARRALERAS